jgi:tRNA/rRNA methyltransferase
MGVGWVLADSAGGECGILLRATAVGLSPIFLAYFCWALSASRATHPSGQVAETAARRYHDASLTIGNKNPVASSQENRAFATTRFVLVEPSHPGNVGAAARALKTMGFSQLVVVAPKIAFVTREPEAIAMASGADDVLAAAQVVETLADALSGVHWSIALTARTREYGPPQMPPRAAVAKAREMTQSSGDSGTLALVFGNERVGLSNADVERCSALAHIPANPAYSSLNLAQAVQVLAYELRLTLLAETEPQATSSSEHASASNDEIEGMYAHLEQALVALDFLDPANPKKLMSRLRRLFSRSGLEHEEVNILRGIAKHVLMRVKRN